MIKPPGKPGPSIFLPKQPTMLVSFPLIGLEPGGLVVRRVYLVEKGVHGSRFGGLVVWWRGFPFIL